MKISNSKTLILLSISVVFLGILLFLTVISVIFKSRESKTIDIEEEYISSRYINDSELEIENENNSLPNEGINLEKQGILQVKEERQTLKIDSVLTEATKSVLEEKYNIEFTNDTESNGIYVINVNEYTDIDELEKELNTVIETDIPVKMSVDTIDWGISRIGADKVWSSGSGNGIQIAIIDTGIQKDHPDLINNIGVGYDFVNNDSDPNDDNGHGTHVAGIASATLNQAGSVGVSNSAKVMPIKVLNSQGYGYLSDVAKGIYFATDNGARVINLSLGSSSDSLILKDAISYASSKGILIVAAAGNDSGLPCSYPAAYTSVICVVATDSRNMLASFSNIGGELAAPGVSNYSTYLGSTYRTLSGTSMASPHVAGAGALLFSICPNCSSSEIREFLKTTAIDLGEPGQDILFGYGLVDLTSAVSKLVTQTITLPTDENTVSEQPVQEPDTQQPTTQKPIKNIPPKEENGIQQNINMLEPTITKGKKYIPTTSQDITVKYTLDPILQTSDLIKVTIFLDNQEISNLNSQEGEFVLKKELFNHSQHWIKLVASFDKGNKSETQIIVDMTYLKSLERTSSKESSKSVLGISTTIFNLFSWIWE